jgi:hypothetical protein
MKKCCLLWLNLFADLLRFLVLTLRAKSSLAPALFRHSYQTLILRKARELSYDMGGQHPRTSKFIVIHRRVRIRTRARASREGGTRDRHLEKNYGSACEPKGGPRHHQHKLLRHGRSGRVQAEDAAVPGAGPGKVYEYLVATDRGYIWREVVPRPVTVDASQWEWVSLPFALLPRRPAGMPR